MSIDPSTLEADPLRQFDAWLAEAETAGLPLATAFALATADAGGAPSVRMVLLRLAAGSAPRSRRVPPRFRWRVGSPQASALSRGRARTIVALNLVP
jgi:hypothetical protein